MRFPALLPLFAALSLLAADAPKPDAPKPEAPKAEDPAKPAAKPAVKAKKLMGIPEIPEGVSIEDGVKLQSAWAKAQDDDAYKAAVAKAKDGDETPKEKGKKKTGAPREAKSERGTVDEALEKAMLRADPSLKPELVRTFLAASHQKAGAKMKKK